ncbi:MAG: hypothetical protein SVY41_02435 [Candidatus Nanohaloarchaea archaeon]|nr:hypothetical protein [Candidatus Nanohaloarchaea archaeon]
MDLRVLAAVFLTLFAVAIGMAQGNVDVTDVRDGLQGIRTGVDLSDALVQDENASGGAAIEGTVTSEDAVDLQIRAPARVQFTAGSDTTVVVGGSTLQPEENTSITAGGFEGNIHIAPDNVTVSGTVTRISTAQLAFDYDTGTEFSTTLETPRLTLTGMERQSLQFTNATGTVTVDATQIEVDQEQAVFNGFSGNLSVDRSAFSLVGTVQRAVLGDAQIR